MLQLLSNPSPAPPAVRRKVVIVSIDAVSPLPPTGKAATDLWRNHVRLALLDAKISPHGLKGSYFSDHLTRDEVKAYANPPAFATAFVGEMKTQLAHEKELVAKRMKQRKPGKKAKKTKRTVRDFMFNRPSWPADYRSWLDAKSGEDLRHVVRNATLKRAIEEEYAELEKAGWPAGKLSDYYKEMARRLNVVPKDHPLETAKAIYGKLYLNPKNLFPGPGGVNQAIGFSADRIIEFGRELADNGDKLVSVDMVADRLSAVTRRYIEQVTRKAKDKMPPDAARTFVEGLANFRGAIKSYIEQQHALWIAEHGTTTNKASTSIVAPSEDLADDVIDMGLNFGFDSILDDGREDDIAERQGDLMETETKLQSSEYVAGTHALTKIFETFLADIGASRSGLNFPVAATHRRLRRDAEGAARVNKGAAVYVTAVLEYLTAEVLELAGNQAREAKRSQIMPEHITRAIAQDEELSDLIAQQQITAFQETKKAPPKKKSPPDS